MNVDQTCNYDLTRLASRSEIELLLGIAMTIARFKVDKFIGENDFTLWRIKMKVLLRQQGLSTTIDVESMTTLKESDADKARDIEAAKAHNTILLSLRVKF